ncbi:hypothetical protein RFM98_26685 [Mesorhizobium sp. VK9D]|uniref:hypothetical protein n=1 Tax=Mesorhizobium australafricanum TaxID=3072311 RepID=UPI002A24BFC4|nr:hypothetical protein [Mesorhizobium sp. VK9D]MDX8456329.1 hypothetical protein [Mesorhizobium sp. VK9D]
MRDLGTRNDIINTMHRALANHGVASQRCSGPCAADWCEDASAVGQTMTIMPFGGRRRSRKKALLGCQR